MATFTLDQLRDAADKKYAPTVIEAGDETFKLPTLLRMDKERRQQVTDLLNEVDSLMDADSDAQLDEALDVFRQLIIKAEVNGNGEKLVELVDDDAVLLDIVNAWLDSTQAGEA